MKNRFFVAAVVSLIASNALAASPYAGEEGREIKALSAEDIEAYLTGQGMGFAKAAELNGYAGPKHVLELAGELELTAEQRTRTQALFASMQTKAVALGRQLVDEERKLDRLFAGASITRGSLQQSVTRIGALQADVRAAHLEAHLEQARILTPEQRAHYLRLRGYHSPGAHHAH
ncbi:MAG TPA: periplasmic heavy metal sensor [Steroidobacteraceae bacterium]|nr:periplasmic heavy metal sensor [Steroidobacteraceae bacterium]